MCICAFRGVRSHWPGNRHDAEPKPKTVIAPASRKPIHERGSIAKDGSSVMPLVYLQAFDRARPVGRFLFLYRVVILLLFACAVVQHCCADNLRTLPLHGVYLTHDNQVLQALAKHTPGTYWIDGYQMAISNQTQICWHDAPLKFGPILSRDGQPIQRFEATSACESAPPGALSKRVWLQYIATQKYRFLFSPLMKVAASRIDVWNDASNGGRGFAPQTAVGPTWQTLCASASPHVLRYPREAPIDVVCDAKVNSYIGSVFSALLKPATITADVPTASREMPSFYVVKRFTVRQEFDFDTINGYLGYADDTGRTVYENPRAHSVMQEIVYAPDGTVLIPDTALAHLKNEAEFAALLTYALVATDQHLIERLFRVQRFKLKPWSTPKDGGNNILYMGKFVLSFNEQVLRLGIQQMYLGDFDVRCAPLAWAVEQGKPIKRSLIVPDYKHMPWYATYAFNDISQFYSDVDYSKLKRGEKEYAAFLDELRKADPQAFEQGK